MSLERLQERMYETYETDNAITNDGKMSGTRYCLNEYEESMKDIVKEFIFHNPLHAGEFPGTRQMEAEIIKMTCDLYGSKDDFGIITTGGSESIMMGVLAARNYYCEKKNIVKPNIVMPISAHVAFNKACYYYNIECIIIPVKKDGKADVKAMAKAINSNTVCIVAGNPSYAAGV